ncbi:MAG: hypothetical protein WAL68_08355, partial [Candidatus Binatus sp.]
GKCSNTVIAPVRPDGPFAFLAVGDRWATLTLQIPGQPHMAAIFNGPSYSKMISQLIEQFSESWRRDYVTVYSPTTGLVAASAKSIRDKLKALSETH